MKALSKKTNNVQQDVLYLSSSYVTSSQIPVGVKPLTVWIVIAGWMSVTLPGKKYKDVLLYKYKGHSAMTWMTGNLHRQIQWLLNAVLSLAFICMISKICLKSSVRLSQIWPFSSSQGQIYWIVTVFSAFSFFFFFILYPLNTFNRPSSVWELLHSSIMQKTLCSCYKNTQSSKTYN